ncbi:hypothetical protein OYC64_018355 [Pagothenia borchgrevinki]|uniref:Uncharacterized protein n=1 Tax=Pagothenia borchgrevinki TaxID=8213 RepID=A0ABD2GQE3_PAGBO
MSFITSRLDYCNSILSTAYHATSSMNSNISRTLLPASSPTPAPETTSLPSSRTSTGSPSVKESTSKSSSLLTKPSTTSPSPPYLTDLLHHHTPSRCLRSSEANLLSIPTRINHRTWGDRAFSVAAPSLWNSLPQPITDLTTFTKLTKTHLFNLAFNV